MGGGGEGRLGRRKQVSTLLQRTSKRIGKHAEMGGKANSNGVVGTLLDDERTLFKLKCYLGVYPLSYFLFLQFRYSAFYNNNGGYNFKAMIYFLKFLHLGKSL